MIKEIRIAEEMTSNTPWYITPDMVTKLKKDGPKGITVYAAQCGDTTIICWEKGCGEFSVKYVSW